jgi:hypothetical protein
MMNVVIPIDLTEQNDGWRSRCQRLAGHFKFVG